MIRVALSLFILLPGWCGELYATSEVPLPWSEVKITTDDRGGASVTLRHDENSRLHFISVEIRGTTLPVPSECMPPDSAVFFNTLRTAYGEFSELGPYWVIEFGIDTAESWDGAGTYRLIFLQDALYDAVVEFSPAKDVFQEHQLCGPFLE